MIFPAKKALTQALLVMNKTVNELDSIMDPLMLTLIFLAIPIGILIGLGAGVIGMTAWPLIVPLLLVFGGYPLHEVLLSSMLVDLVIAANLSVFYLRKPELEIDGMYATKLGATAGIVATITAIAVFPILAQYSHLFKGGSTIVTMILGSLFIVQAVRMNNVPGLKANDIPEESSRNRFSDRQKDAIAYGFCIIQGFLTGLLAMGGAMNIVIVLMFLIGYPTLRAVGTAMITTTIMLTMTVIAYLILMQFTLSTLPLVILYLVLAAVSSYVAVIKVQHIPERKLRFTIGIVILASAIFASVQVFMIS